MQKKIMLINLAIVVLAGCGNRSVGSENHNEVVDAATPDAATDAQVQLDASNAIAVVTYETTGRIDPIWDTTPTNVTRLKLRATYDSTTATRIVWTLNGLIVRNWIQNARLLMGGVPITQDATWLDDNHLEFNINLSLPQNVDVFLDLEITTDWALCGDILFDIAEDFHISATSANSATAIIVEGAASVAPSLVPIEGIRFNLGLPIPDPLVFPGTQLEILNFSIISSNSFEVLSSTFNITASPGSEADQFDSIRLQTPGGIVLGGPTGVGTCNTTSCQVEFTDTFFTTNNCQIDNYQVQLQILSPAPSTAFNMELTAATWVLLDNQGVLIPVEAHSEVITSGTFVVGP